RPTRTAPLRAREIAALAALVVLADLALWGPYGRGLGAGGFGLALFFAAIPVALLAGAHRRRLTRRLAVVGSLLAVVAGRCLYEPSAGLVALGLALLFAFALSLRSRGTFVPEAAASLLAAAARVPSRIGALAAGARRLFAGTRLGRMSVLPVVVPAGLSLVFLGVFALGNPVVAHGLGRVSEVLGAVVGLPSVGHLFFWGFVVVGAVTLLRPATRLARGGEAAVVTGESSPLARTTARNTLGALNALFLAHNALDAAYLWSGAPPAGLDTRHYAHEGAFWLTVALVMLTAVVSVLFRGPLASDPQAKAARALAFLWMGQGVVLALGTYRRIAIHVGHSGLSDLRIVGILGTTLVVAGLGLVAWKLRHRRSFTWLLRRQLDALVLTLVVYAVLPTHLVSARVNVARIEGGEYRPVLHMFRQSMKAESADALVPLLRHPDVRVRQGVAALLERTRAQLEREVHGSAGERPTWRERDLASERALAALDAAAPLIAATLGAVDRDAARDALLDVSRIANEGSSLEELLAVPSASERNGDGRRSQY
ncbi:MAG: hypothetical protein JWP97_4197, partial [Labilithrix sp.]|nr:hypothetical protein [Labilithrix sp.]